MDYQRPPATELRLVREIDAPPDAVYDAWLDPHRPGGPWYGAKRALVDARVDGLFYHCVEFDRREWAHYGRFVVLDRPRTLRHTWVSEATRGLETLVTLSFEPSPGGGTRVTLVHSGVPDDAFGRQHAEGWAFILDAIAQRLAPV